MKSSKRVVQAPTSFSDAETELNYQGHFKYDKWGRRLFNDGQAGHSGRASISNLGKVFVKDTGMYGVPRVNHSYAYETRQYARPQTAGY